MKILKKRGVVEKRGEEETKSMPHVPVITSGVDEQNTQTNVAFRYFHTKSTKYIHLYILYMIYRIYGV
jgi:hypothetical protein